MRKSSVMITLLFSFLLIACAQITESSTTSSTTSNSFPTSSTSTGVTTTQSTTSTTTQTTTQTTTSSMTTSIFVDPETPLNHSQSMKVLAIGNSFSDDALEYLWRIANSYGIEEVVIANLYMAGARLSHHWDNIQNNPDAYIYRKDTSGQWENRANTSIEYAIQDEKWDIITLQQSSGYSGRNDSYQPYLDELMTYVLSKTTNESVRIYWHLTWAYQSDYTVDAFAWYNRNQMTMYQAIINSVHTHIIPRDDIYGIIPAGTAIQNVRSGFLKDTLTRDGYHLTYDIGRYAAALTWFHKLTGFSLDNIGFRPNGVSDLEQALLIESAVHAVQNPFSVSVSKYLERRPSGDEYTLASYEFTLGYYDSKEEHQGAEIITDAPLSKYFITHKQRFTKTDLPVGSILILGGELKFKISLWDNDGGNHQTDFIAFKDLIITEELWASYDFIAISVAANYGIINLTNKVEEIASLVQIYLPKTP